MLKSRGNFSGNARYEGFCIDLLKEIAHMVGFAYRIELVPDGKYGVYDYETGEWNGIVRQLMDKVSIRLSASNASPNSRRTEFVCALHRNHATTTLSHFPRRLARCSAP